MKVLVFSDSHSDLRFMHDCIEKYDPDAILHLGDYYSDAESIHQSYPRIPLYRVPGNCDEYRCPAGVEQTVVMTIGCVKIMMTHGHLHRVKMHTQSLIYDAMERGVQAVFYGHTHKTECRQMASGLWVMNPGTCGYYNSSAGLMTIENGKITDMRIID